MVTSRLELHAADLRSKLLPLLRGQVFHVTTVAGLDSILADGVIKTNQDGTLTTSPRYHNSYFRARGCVSLCDLRAVSEEEIDTALGQYYFLNPEGRFASPVFLFIRSNCFTSLIPWTQQRTEKAFELLVVSYVEAGYPGDFPLDCIEKALSVTIIHPPLGPHLEALLRIRGDIR